MKNFLICSLLLVFLLPFRAASQVVQPPRMQCLYVLITGNIKVDWSVPSNTCGPFVAYYLYRSTSINGPYSLVASITDPFQSTYTDNVGNGASVTYYYYMVSDFNCPGATFPTSDTLDNLDPEPPVIDYVTVSNGAAEVHWQPSPSPEVYGYIIYHVVDGLTPPNQPIDTVYGSGVTSYVDPVANPGTGSVSYTIATIDSCINTGPLNDFPQHTVFLEDTLYRCRQTIELKWTPYENWPLGVEEYQLFLEKNGGSPALLATLPQDSLTYTATGLDDGDQLCFTVVAKAAGSGFLSASNEICIQFNVVQPAHDFYIRNCTVLDEQVHLFYSMDDKADLLSVEVQRGLDSLSMKKLEIIPPPADLSMVNVYIDSSALVDQLSYYYRLIATDSCGGRDTSSVAKTILLKGYAFSDLSFYTYWTESILGYGVVQDYVVYRDDGSGLNPVATVDENTFVFEEQQAPVTDPCYAVEAVLDVALPNGITETVLSRSNELCLNQPSQIYMPNAFAPEGTNALFRPILNIETIKSFSFSVYNRWGELLFSTTDPDEGWNGRYKGFLVQQGAYAYLVQAVDGTGKSIEAKGTVLVVR